MKHPITTTCLLVLGLMALGAGCGGEKPMVDVKPSNKAKIEEQTRATGTEPEKKTGIANPATTKCVNDKLQLKKIIGTEGEMYICIFDDKTECEEWSYFRGECKKGDCTDWATCTINKQAGQAPAAAD